jgi:hypothetical protein
MYSRIGVTLATVALVTASVMTAVYEERAAGIRKESLPFIPVQTEQPFPGPPSPPGAATANVPADIPPDPYGNVAPPVPDYPMYVGDPVMGGGLGMGGDPAARQLIGQQLPAAPDPGVTVGDGQSAVDFIRAVSKFNSTASRAFNVLRIVGDCAYQNGTFAARTYRSSSDFYWAGGILVVSDRESRNIFQNLLGCAGNALSSVMGGGQGSSAFEPCSTSFTYATPYDRYYVVLGGATGAFCSWATGTFAQFAPTQWP